MRMDMRVWGAAALLLAAIAGCDSSRHDTMPGAGAAASDLHLPEQPRSGTIILGERNFHFVVGICSIQHTSPRKRFMLIGRGETELGQPFTVNADGTLDSAAIVLRVRYRRNTPATSYTARIDSAHLRLDGRTISASGTFHSHSHPTQDGQFSARCETQRSGERL